MSSVGPNQNLALTQQQIFSALKSGEPMGMADVHIDSVETAVSRLVLTRRNGVDGAIHPDDVVIKYKRVDVPRYVNGYDTLENRRIACEKEFAFNSPNAPGIYLGIDEIRHHPQSGKVKISPSPLDGDVVEYAVRMRRLDESQNMLWRLDRGVDVAHSIPDLARSISDMHSRSTILKQDDPAGYLLNMAKSDGYLGLLKDVNDEFRKANMSWEADRVADLMLTSLQIYSGTIRERCANGWIRHCHADLHAANIWFDDHDKPIFLDGIEFNDDFTTTDVWQDLANLTGDLLLRDYTNEAADTLTEYERASGETLVPGLVNLFVADRITVRLLLAMFDVNDIKDKMAKEGKTIELQKQLAERFDFVGKAVNLSTRLFAYAADQDSGWF